MAKFNNFNEWQIAVKEEYDKLHACYCWLTEEGKERRYVYFTLWDLSNFCATAKELVNLLDSREGLDSFQTSALNSVFSHTPIEKLRDIAANETE